MKQRFIKTLLLAIAIPGLLYSQSVTVNLSSEKQLIKGFGGINHPNWYSDLNANERAIAFGNNAGQLGLTVLRTYVSDLTSQWGDGIATTQYAYNNGVTVFATPWNPPVAMTTTVNGKKCINPAYYSQYANHLNDYVTFMKNKGVELYAISTQNEPDYAHDWTEWTPQQSVDFIKGYADKINCRLMTPESFQYRKTIYDPILNDADALSKVDVFGTHLYGTAYADFSYPNFQQKGAGKELWMTEVYTDSKYDANVWVNDSLYTNSHAIKVAEHIHYAMVQGNFQTYVYWPIRRHYALIHDGTNATVTFPGVSPAAAGTVTKRGWCMAQFSKFVRPGYVRVDATASPTTNVFVSAYKKDNNVVIVAVNKTTSTKTISFSIPNAQVTEWERYTTSATKNVAKGTNIAASTSFQVTLDAASVTTFVGKADSGVPSVKFIQPNNNSEYSAPATFTVDVTATDDDGTIAHIDFYLDNETTSFHEEWQAPYAFEVADLPAGLHTIKAIAYDNDGKTAEDILTVSVQGSYLNTVPSITDKIQFEEYDKGGNGFAYFDDTDGSETTVVYRAEEDVDIEACTDTDGGYNVGYANAGEWLEYTVNVPTSGTYKLVVRAACSGDNRTISATIDGKVLASDIAVPNTTGWQKWTDVSVPDLQMEAGQHVIRITIGAGGYVNLNYFTFVPTSLISTTIPLSVGWNLIGCPIEGETDIATALSSIWDKVEIVKNDEFYYDKSQPDFMNRLKTLNWSGGYMVKVSAACELEW